MRNTLVSLALAATVWANAWPVTDKNLPPIIKGPAGTSQEVIREAFVWATIDMRTIPWVRAARDKAVESAMKVLVPNTQLDCTTITIHNENFWQSVCQSRNLENQAKKHLLVVYGYLDPEYKIQENISSVEKHTYTIDKNKHITPRLIDRIVLSEWTNQTIKGTHALVISGLDKPRQQIDYEFYSNKMFDLLEKKQPQIKQRPQV